jgi:hypothetical protein
MPTHAAVTSNLDDFKRAVILDVSSALRTDSTRIRIHRVEAVAGGGVTLALTLGGGGTRTNPLELERSALELVADLEAQVVEGGSRLYAGVYTSSLLALLVQKYKN